MNKDDSALAAEEHALATICDLTMELHDPKAALLQFEVSVTT